MNSVHDQISTNTLGTNSRFRRERRLGANPDSSFYISSSQFWRNLNQREERSGKKKKENRRTAMGWFEE
jgi:hypothetical protein